MMQALIGQKKSQSQKFLEDGTRIPVTYIEVLGGNIITQTKTQDKEGYNSLQLGFGTAKNINKAALGHIKRTASSAVPRFLREVRVDGSEMQEAGAVIKPTDIFEAGDVVDVTGVSKGKGFAGVVKRHHFKGGPRTHGQSDRERAPGSIGQTTTPGRVYKGKRMAGRMGHENVTVKNLEVVEVGDEYMLIKGLVPGGLNNLIMIKKVGTNKKFEPLYKEPSSAEASEGQGKVEGEEVAPEVEAEPIAEPEVAEAGASSDNLPHVSDDVQPSEEIQSTEPASLSVNQAPEGDTETQQESAPISSSSENGQTAAASSEEVSKDVKEEGGSSDAKDMEDKENAS